MEAEVSIKTRITPSKSMEIIILDADIDLYGSGRSKYVPQSAFLSVLSSFK